MCVCAPLILTVSPDCVNLRNTLDPSSGCGCYGGAWKIKTKTKKKPQIFFYFYFLNQILSRQIISKQAAVSKSRSTVIKNKPKPLGFAKATAHLQDNEGREVGEGIVWNVCDLVEGQRHGLKGRQGVECRHWDFC